MAIINSKKSLQGAKVPHRKNTKDKETVELTAVKKVTLLMQQHMGAPCQPTVKVGDLVTLGQVVGDSDEYFSVPIHASCSGKVTQIIEVNTVSGVKTKAVVIENDFENTLCPDIAPPKIVERADFVKVVRNSGLVGLGGAGFPVHVKLDYKNIEKLNTLIINAAECEPYITSDDRECLENTQNILDGITAVCKYLKIPNVYFGIESNKPKALEHISNATKNNSKIKVVKLKSIYPQGGEKSIIYATTGIVVKEGKLPADCGAIVMNVSSIGFIGKHLKDGIPLVSKRLTVDGDCVELAQNIRVPLGTPVGEILDFCKTSDEVVKVLMGGPMMGIPVTDRDAPVVKNNNAILAFSINEIVDKLTTDCIRCGKCISACPISLMPTALEKAYDTKNIDELIALKINLCINCGCCTYTCPAKRNLAQKNQLAKALIRKNSKPKK